MNFEQDGFFKKAQDSLKIAKILLKEELYEVAVSRAYYAMFHAAQTFLLAENLTFSKHSAVISAFGNKYAKTGIVPAKFHRYLLDAFDLRILGDYKINTEIDAAVVNEQIEKAEEFVNYTQQNLK